MELTHITDKNKVLEASRLGNKYAIGVDYGTESGRAVLVNLSDGTELADHVTPYPHNVIDEQRGEAFLPRYGGKISSEWMIAKIWQILNEAPEIYERTDLFLEATDWVIAQMTGNTVRNSCTAGYKSIWHKRDGYPSKE